MGHFFSIFRKHLTQTGFSQAAGQLPAYPDVPTVVERALRPGKLEYLLNVTLAPQFGELMQLGEPAQCNEGTLRWLMLPQTGNHKTPSWYSLVMSTFVCSCLLALLVKRLRSRRSYDRVRPNVEGEQLG